MSDNTSTTNVLIEAGKSAPAVAASGVVLTSGPSLADQASIIVSVLTALYVLMQMAFLLRRELRARRARQQEVGTK